MIEHCIVCGGHNDGNHHCLPETIVRIEAGRKGWENRGPCKTYYGTRLEEGFIYFDWSEDYQS